MNEKIIGIDLGTTNSEVAVVEDGQVTVIDVDHSQLLASVVGIDENDQILVGESARNQYALYPERTVKSIKRHMGSDESTVLADKSFMPQEISAFILKKLKQIAENYLGQCVKKAVITVPAYFSDSQRQATREAGEIAGLEVVRMINEPTAAALAYQIDSEEEKKILVYDLGGGTFDVSVVSIQEGVTEVLASHGNNHLGGDDFDEKIALLLRDHLLEKGVDDLHNDPILCARIERIAEESKCRLSNEPFVQIEEEYIATVNDEPTHLTMELSRDDYEIMIQPFIDETLEAVHIALEDAHLHVSDIDEILLVGGSTHTPLIQNSLQNLFSLRAHGEINPDLCVATGAAIQAGTIAGEAISSILVDVTPYTFGTSTLHELDGELTAFYFVPIIHKNSALPCKKSDVFYTNVDNQKKVEINIYEGEDKSAQNNILLGQFMISNLSKEPAGNPITVELELDLDGILQVTAKEKNTGIGGSLTIENALQKRNDDDLLQARERIDSLYSSSNEPELENETINDEQNKAIIQARELIKKAEKMMDDISDEDREDMVDLIEAINDAITINNMENLSKVTEALTDIIYYMEA